MWEIILGIAAVVSAIFAVLSYFKPTVQFTEKSQNSLDGIKHELQSAKDGNNSSGAVVGFIICLICVLLALALWFLVLSLIGLLA